VIKPHGVRGEVVVLPHSDRPERFPSLKEAFVPAPDGGARTLRVETTFPHKERFVVKFEGVDTMDDAELLRGKDLRIPEELLEPLPEGSYYHHQLIGLAVYAQDGQRIGEVAEILEHSATPTIAIKGRFGRELLIPFVDDFVKDVDLEAKVLKVHIDNEDDVDSKTNPHKAAS
jgi:16S rRNA processing protein RimM